MFVYKYTFRVTLKSPLFEYRNMICSSLADWYGSNVSIEYHNPLVQQIPRYLQIDFWIAEFEEGTVDNNPS